MEREAFVRGLRDLWPALMLLAGVGASGVLTQKLPAAVISLIAGATLAATAWLFYRAIIKFSPIDEREARHRLERQAGLSESAPLTSFGDRQVGGDRALWAWQKQRSDQVAGAFIKPASAEVSRRDWAKLAALSFATALCLWQPGPAGRALSFDLSPIMGDSDLVMDAWAQPPGYTGLPVIRLNRETPEISLPEGSIIVARMDGAKGAPKLRVAGQTLTMSRVPGQAWTGQAILRRSGDVALDRFGARAKWHVTAIKDQPPVLTRQQPIKIDPRGRLELSFSASDDYGVAAAFIRINSRDKVASLLGQDVFDTPLVLEGEAGDGGARQVFVDVADHVLTGLEVDVTLIVRDGLGQETASTPTRLIMPKRQWSSPLGGALQEQRLLILREARPYQPRPPAFARLFDPETGLSIRLDLREPLQGAPDGIAKAYDLLSATLASLQTMGLSDAGLLGLRFARERLALARTIEDAHAVAPLLWELALQAELSDQTPAQQKIAQAREALEQALKNGASDEDVKDLTQALREAVGERLDELAAQSAQGGGQGQNGPDNSVSGGDIDALLRELEQSGSSGARKEALDQLDKLADLMENLQPGGQAHSQSGEGGRRAGGTSLDDAMLEQRELSDQTDSLKGQSPQASANDLADRQDDLAKRLSPQSEPAQKGTEPQGQDDKAAAAQAMRQAGEALRRGDVDGAREAQARAEQALQQAAQAQAAAGGFDAQDPLGRTLPRSDDGGGTKVPSQAEKRRARDVREELRRRQADPNRDSQERDYLDRLLKDR